MLMCAEVGAEGGWPANVRKWKYQLLVSALQESELLS